MDEAKKLARGERAQPAPLAEDVTRKFVEHWGMMARAWGINATMGELFALLFITAKPWTADDLREWLQVSRGNVSMNLRELLAWGVVHKIHRPGERREFFYAEEDVWNLFRRILTERKRRELAPTLKLLDQTYEITRNDPSLDKLKERIEPLTRFFALINSLTNRLLTLNSDEFDELQDLIGVGESSGDPSEAGIGFDLVDEFVEGDGRTLSDRLD